MTKTSFMEKLLNGVEMQWKALREIANFTNGKGHEKDILENGRYIVINSKFISSDGRVAKYSDKQICPLFTDDILIVMSDLPNGKALAKTFYVHENEKYTLNQRIGAIRVKDNRTLFPKFLNTFLNRTSQLTKYDDGINQTNLRKEQILEVQIPIPPLEIQAEIVRILSAFAVHTAQLKVELQAEITARKKQYNYYRDKLLTFEEGKVEWKTLGEVGELVRGNGLQKKDFTETGVPAIHYGQIYTYYGICTTQTKSFVSPELAKTLRKVDTGDVVITNTSENLEDVGKAMVYLGDTQAVTGGHATIFKPSKIILGTYFAYFTQTKVFTNQKRKYAKGTKVIDVSATDMAKITIPIPPIDDQARVVSILERLDSVTNSITESLPREIELRQKQYEYYRDLLLSFPKLKVDE